jgi:deoxyribodipyrimidine photo-lyase
MHQAPSPRRALHWFRSDLRIHDNPAFAEAAAAGALACIFIDETNETHRACGGASRWWLHHSLAALSQAIAERGGTLILMRGNSRAIIPEVANRLGCDLVTWNRRYSEAERKTDSAIKEHLKDAGIRAESFNGGLLYEPWEVQSQAGGPMRVFTPFWKAARATRDPARPLPAPARLPLPMTIDLAGVGVVRSLDALGYLPTRPDWAGGLRAAFTPGEAGAMQALDAFIVGPLEGYADHRDRPDFVSTSRLSPHLASGDLSPRQIWHAVETAALTGRTKASDRDIAKFFAELGWREFSHHLLFHYPHLPNANYQPKFDAFPWRKDDAALRAWQRGLTGYPMVDAGMRELWQTGFMHNRVRMIVASFLIKHLMIDWREGEAWFWDTLCDADPANNAASWQWVAGSGADAAPYFRIFNPFGQGEKFDAKGDYVRRYVPEIAGLPDDLIHTPWLAPPHILARAGVRLDETYPRPIIDHDFARARALEAFKSISVEAA